MCADGQSEPIAAEGGHGRLSDRQVIKCEIGLKRLRGERFDVAAYGDYQEGGFKKTNKLQARMIRSNVHRAFHRVRF
jgi:hypothetical protein